MDLATVAIYEERGLGWAADHSEARRLGDAQEFAEVVGPGRLRVDLGCGAGRYLGHLGTPVVALDASPTMLGAALRTVPGALGVVADLEHLPFLRGTVAGGWSWMAHQHLTRDRLPLALWDVHRTLAVGARLRLQVPVGRYEGRAFPTDAIGGRLFTAWEPDELVDVLVGAGFEIEEAPEVVDHEVGITAVRAPTLADTVGPDMRLLVCGVNPSPTAADMGVGYGRPGNRFWPAALRAGIVTRDRDPVHALVHDGVGMTDFAKRPTRTAAEVTDLEFRVGRQRLERLVRRHRPGALCIVGLSGWRNAVDRRAVAGAQPVTLGGRPVYVMPSTSGLNAHATVDSLAGHLTAAARLADAGLADAGPTGPGRDDR